MSQDKKDYEAKYKAQIERTLKTLREIQDKLAKHPPRRWPESTHGWHSSTPNVQTLPRNEVVVDSIREVVMSDYITGSLEPRSHVGVADKHEKSMYDYLTSSERLAMNTEQTQISKCTPCNAPTRRVVFDSFQYDYCDSCKNEIRNGYPKNAQPRDATPVKARTHNFARGMAVLYKYSGAADWYVSKVEGDKIYIIGHEHYHSSPSGSYGPVPSEDLSFDYSRQWFKDVDTAQFVRVLDSRGTEIKPGVAIRSVDTSGVAFGLCQTVSSVYRAGEGPFASGADYVICVNGSVKLARRIIVV